MALKVADRSALVTSSKSRKSDVNSTTEPPSVDPLNVDVLPFLLPIMPVLKVTVSKFAPAANVVGAK